MVWLIPRKVKYQPALKISSREGEVQAENLICRFGRHFVQWITNYLLQSNIVKTIVFVGFSNISIKSVTQSKAVRNY